VDTSGVRFFAHGERVARGARRGVVKDVCGLDVNIIWDDDASREWVPVAELHPAESG
jgi:hypothetical protein